MKKHEFIHKNEVYLLSFLIPIVAMLLLFIQRGIYPFGDESFLHIDMYHQYFPFLTEFYRKLKSGDSLLYSWNAGIGSNFLALYVYYLASPFNWLVTIVPENLIMEFMTYLIVLKLGLCGLTFSYYTSHHFKTKHISIAFFAIAYALSGYLAAYNWNVMWLDVIVLAPLVILGLERLVLEGRCKLYCITLALSILTNYYLSIMLCFFLVCYFLVLLVTVNHTFREILKSILRFALYSLIAGGISAILLLPELEMLLMTEFSSTPFPSKSSIYYSYLDCLARQFMDVTVETGLDHWPNIYCSVMVLLLVPLYLVCKKIPLKEKIGKAVLIVFLFISFSNNILTFIWHGFNYPDSLPSRQSFLYIFLLLTISFEALMHIREYSDRVLIILCSCVTVFVALCAFFVKDDAFTSTTFIVTGTFLLLYVMLVFMYRRNLQSEQLFTCFTLGIISIELAVNTFATSVPTVSRSDYLADFNSYETLIADCRANDSDFYRIEKKEPLTQNDAMLVGYQSASLFSSTANALINQFYEKYGLRSSRVFYCNTGATPFTSAFLSEKYFFSKKELPSDSLYTLVDSDSNIYLYKNTYSLPFGFMIPLINTSDSDYIDTTPDFEEILDETDSTTPISAQNALSYLLGGKSAIFTPITVEDKDNDGATITVKEDGHIYAYSQNSGVKSITAKWANDKKEFSKLKNHYVIDLGWQNAGTVITLKSDNYLPLDLIAYKLSEDSLAALTETVNKQAMKLDSYDSTQISGHITVTDPGNLVLTIPYESGWSVLVDGVKQDYALYEGAMITLPLSRGEHIISLKFTSNSFVYGSVISLMSLLFFALCTFLKKRLGEKQDQSN